MARKQRDYRAEERRRNQLAQERGYRTRAQQRKAIETGFAPAIQPKRIRSPKTIEGQKFLLGLETEGRERLASPEITFLGSTRSDKDRAQDWSDLFARSTVAVFDPDNRPEGMSESDYTQAYLNAFVVGDDRYVKTRHRGGSESLRHWFVDIMGYMAADEYESRYGDKGDA